MRRVDVVAPHGAGEAVDGIVGNGYGLLGIIESDHRHDGAKDLFLRDAHVIADAVEDRRLVVTAAGLFHDLLAACDQRGAFAPAYVDVIDDRFQLRRIDHRPHRRRRIERIAGHPVATPGNDHLDEFLANAVLDDEPRTGGAGLAAVVEHRDRGE